MKFKQVYFLLLGIASLIVAESNVQVNQIDEIADWLKRETKGGGANINDLIDKLDSTLGEFDGRKVQNSSDLLKSVKDELTSIQNNIAEDIKDNPGNPKSARWKAVSDSIGKVKSGLSGKLVGSDGTLETKSFFGDLVDNFKSFLSKIGDSVSGMFSNLTRAKAAFNLKVAINNASVGELGGFLDKLDVRNGQWVKINDNLGIMKNTFGEIKRVGADWMDNMENNDVNPVKDFSGADTATLDSALADIKL